jgi:uncharacterized protein YlxW (UPF0749 family)
MKIQDLSAMDKPELINLVGDLQARLKTKEQKLHQTRQKLNHAKVRLRSMKDTVIHQRSRLLELYKGES